MAMGEQIKLTTLQKRGNGTCVTIAKKLQARLGWNKGDALRMDVVKGSLVVTKVTLSAPPDVVDIATTVHLATDVLPVSDNK